MNENRGSTENKIDQQIKQSNEVKMKKTRESKKINNALTNSKILYQTVSRLKSKVDSLTLLG